MTEMTPEQLQIYQDWIMENPEKFEFFRQLIASFMDKRFCRIERILVRRNIFPFSGILMGIRVESTTHRMVDESGKEHAIIFITSPR